MAILGRPICIVCRRLISPQTTTVYARAEVTQRDREHEARMGGLVRTVAGEPRTKLECQALVNEAVVNVRYSHVPGVIDRFTTWDGTSYKDAYFCSQICAARQGYASAARGDRYKWE